MTLCKMFIENSVYNFLNMFKMDPKMALIQTKCTFHARRRSSYRSPIAPKILFLVIRAHKL